MTTTDVLDYEVLASYVRHVPEKRRVGQGWTALSDIVPAYDEDVEIRKYKNMQYDRTYQRWEDNEFKPYMTEADALDWVRSIKKIQQMENGVGGPAGMQPETVSINEVFDIKEYAIEVQMPQQTEILREIRKRLLRLKSYTRSMLTMESKGAILQQFDEIYKLFPHDSKLSFVIVNVEQRLLNTIEV
jgi:hypothetical protein